MLIKALRPPENARKFSAFDARISRRDLRRPIIFLVNDRLPYADVSIAAVLVAVGTALAAAPWLEGTAVLSLALATALAVLAMADLFNRSGRRTRA
jgi:hypothetical protein